jgi:hypothetical protein
MRALMKSNYQNSSSRQAAVALPQASILMDRPCVPARARHDGDLERLVR